MNNMTNYYLQLQFGIYDKCWVYEVIFILFVL